MQSTFAGYGLISRMKTRGKIGEKAHNPTLIFLMAILLIQKKALLPLVSNLIRLSKGEQASTSHPQVWYGSGYGMGMGRKFDPPYCIVLFFPF